MTARRSRIKSPKGARAFDWFLLSLLVALSGSAFVMIREAVTTIPPQAVASIRLWVGALLMTVIMLSAGRRFPPLLARSARGCRLHRAWAPMLAVGMVGYTIPFFIYPWAQQYVESGLAGVYMAFMPVWTVGLAYLFADEGLTRGKIGGFALGFAGVVILMGPDAVSGAARSSAIAQGGLLVATFCYAVSAIIARRTRGVRPRVFTAGAILSGAVFSSPALFLTDLHTDQWSLPSIASVIGLAVAPTGLAGLVIIVIIKRAGAGFMALANYLVPVWAIFLGALLFGERLEPRVFLALAIIFAGVAISQRKSGNPPPAEGVAAMAGAGGADLK